MDQGDHLKKIPFILVTGFLGSGKTSLLLDLVQRYADTLRIALVQNEFTPGHVDGFTLRQSGKLFDILEINNGSVFCACLLGDFITRLSPFIRETHPDLILLEATGLADPVSLGQVLQAPELAEEIYLAGSWCLVDALNFKRIIGTVSRARHQVRIADIVWINKTDLVKDTEEVRAGILELNPTARIVETTFGNTGQLELSELLHLEPAGSQIPVYGSAVSEPKPDIRSCVVRSNRSFEEPRIREFLTAYSTQLYRLKGYIRIDEDRTMAVQSAFNDLSIKIISGYSGPSELIAIGPDLDIRSFSKEFLSHQKK